MIPEAAVEAAWDNLLERGRTGPIDYEELRTALEAAAPHIAADAWDEGYQGCYDRYMYEPVPTNPYRTAK